MKHGDLIHQKEQALSRRFGFFGPEVVQALLRVFRRYGHFRPLLEHMKLVAAGDLGEQEDTLFRILSRYGERVFMQAVEEGTNPTQIVSKIWETPLEVVAEGVLVPIGAESASSEKSARVNGRSGTSAFGAGASTFSTAASKPIPSAETIPLPEFQAMGAPVSDEEITGGNIPGASCSAERRKLSDRRRNSPGRRHTVSFDMSDERRRGACRRKSKRRATD
jgi:hypothetical protein